MKTGYKGILLGLTLCVVPMAMYGCDKPMSFEVQSNVKTKIDGVVEYLVNNAYNNEPILGKSVSYSVSEISTKLTNFEYYVNLGTLKNADVKILKLNNISFEKDQMISLSIGNSNYIKDKVWYQEGTSLFVAAPVVAFEIGAGDKVSINGKDFDLKLTTAPADIAFSQATVQGVTNTLTKVSDTEYNVVFSNATQYLALNFEGAQNNDVVLTKKMLNGKENGYGLTKVETIAGNPIALYPMGYKANFADVSEDFNNSVYEYSAYIIGKGMANIKFNITLNR